MTESAQDERDRVQSHVCCSITVKDKQTDCTQVCDPRISTTP